MRIKEMKTKIWIAATMLAASLYTTTASAEFVIGVKGGTVDFDITGSDPALNGSIQLAFDILDIGIADIALEAEYSTSLTDGEIDMGLLGAQDASFESTALYTSLRTAGPIYVIARIGYAKAEIETDFGSIDDEGISKGVGVGFSMGLRMELEYTSYEIEDLDIKYLTLGFAF
jgi:hypothetical protein